MKNLRKYCFWVVFILAGFSLDVFAGGSIDAGANTVYQTFLSLGKWAIIIKGAITVIKEVMSGDISNAKQTSMQYVLAYAMLLGLPWALTQVDIVFKSL